MPATGVADVFIQQDELVLPCSPEYVNERYALASDQEAYLSWQGIVTIRVRDGREIVYSQIKKLDENLLRQYLLGPALGVLLQQRGLLVLHASSVAIEGHAMAFLGWKGYGKSTTAALMYTRGYELLADDIVAIDMSDTDNPAVLPGFGQIKLWPDSVAMLGIESGPLPRLLEQTEKRALRLKDAPKPLSAALKALYILDRGQVHTITELGSTESFNKVFQNSYAARFIGNAGLPDWHFHHSATLIRKVPGFCFKRIPSLDRLKEGLDLLEHHFNKSHAELLPKPLSNHAHA